MDIPYWAWAYMYQTIADQLGVCIVNYRARNGLTQEQMAEYLKVDIAKLKGLEDGSTKFSVVRLAKIAAKLGLKVTISEDQD